MSCPTENKHMKSIGLHEGDTLTGKIVFDEKERYCYILTLDGLKIPTTPMFDFFNGFISLKELIDKFDDNYYTRSQIGWFRSNYIKFRKKQLSPEGFYKICKDYFGF
jgi:hypothetical protein